MFNLQIQCWENIVAKPTFFLMQQPWAISELHSLNVDVRIILQAFNSSFFQHLGCIQRDNSCLHSCCDQRVATANSELQVLQYNAIFTHNGQQYSTQYNYNYLSTNTAGYHTIDSCTICTKMEGKQKRKLPECVMNECLSAYMQINMKYSHMNLTYFLPVRRGTT